MNHNQTTKVEAKLNDWILHLKLVYFFYLTVCNLQGNSDFNWENLQSRNLGSSCEPNTLFHYLQHFVTLTRTANLSFVHSIVTDDENEFFMSTEKKNVVMTKWKIRADIKSRTLSTDVVLAGWISKMSSIRSCWNRERASMQTFIPSNLIV